MHDGWTVRTDVLMKGPIGTRLSTSDMTRTEADVPTQKLSSLATKRN